MKMTKDAKLEKTLTSEEREILAEARAGRRNHRMDGWTFRIGHRGLAGRRAIEAMPWNHDKWFFVSWLDTQALTDAMKASLTSPQTLTSSS